MITQEQIFKGKVNSDADISVFPEGDLINSENVNYITSADGRLTSVRPVKGTRLIKSGEPGAMCVGSFAEEESGRLYYFTHSPNGNHKIECFEEATQTVKTVFDGPEIDLDSALISGIDKIGDILYWVQDNKPPKKINVERGLAAFTPGYVSPDGTRPQAYDAFTGRDFQIIRPYPEYAPKAKKITQQSVITNLVDDNAFQFAFSFVYKDKEISVLSPYSMIVPHNSEGEDFNAIEVTMDARLRIQNEVDRIRLHVRLGNTGSFFTVKEWRRDVDNDKYLDHNFGTSPLTYIFYNDTNGIAVSEEYSAKLFDAVPITSKAIAAAKNRLFLGNNVFGYEIPQGGTISALAISGTVGLSNIYGTFVFASAELLIDSNPFGYNQALFVKVQSFGDDRDGYYDVTSILSPWDFSTSNLPPIVTLSPSLKVLSLAEGDIDSNLQQYVLQTIPGWDSGVDYFATYSVERDYPGGSTAGDVIIYGLAGTPSGTDTSMSFKSGSQYRFGIVFYDIAGRSAGVYTGSQPFVFIPERTYSDPSITNVDLSLSFTSDQIPVWASHYQIVRTKSLTYQSFLQGYGNDIQYVGKDSDGNWKFGDVPDSTVFTSTFNSGTVQGIAVNISPAVSFGLGYSFLEGDVITIWTTNGSKYSLEIVSQIGSYVIAQALDIGSLQLNSTPHLFEIYTPRKSFLEETFYEVGHIYPIMSVGLPERYLSTTSIKMSGDTHIKFRAYVNGTSIVEAMNPSDKFWKEWWTDIGRPNISIPDGTLSIRPTNICFSNVFLLDTQINGLSSFDALDYRDLDISSGAIRSLKLTIRTQEYGSVMLAISESETSSIYLQETRLVDNAENAIIATSASVIGTINNLKGSFGTMNPESVYAEEGKVFYVDRVKGKIIQYSNNGLEVISENSMANFFTSALYEVNALRMPAVVDKRNNTYMFFLPDVFLTPILRDQFPESVEDPHVKKTGVVWCYGIESNSWYTAMTFMPDLMDCINRRVISFKGSDLYLHDDETMQFYNEPFSSIVSFPMGVGSYDVKVPQAISIQATSAPDWVHVKNEHPFLQGSDIVYSEFVSREGTHYASFFRDRLTPGYNTTDQALLLGDHVRGTFLPTAIKYSSPFYMTRVVLQYDVSSGHPMLKSK
jgi:hypothetical protein